MIILECDNCQKQDDALNYPQLPSTWCELTKMNVSGDGSLEKRHVCCGDCLKEAVNKSA